MQGSSAKIFANNLACPKIIQSTGIFIACILSFMINLPGVNISHHSTDNQVYVALNWT